MTDAVVPEARLVSEMERVVLARIASGRLVVPAMPAVATRCLGLLRSAEVDHRALVRAMEAEPVLVALVMRDANSAAYGSFIKTLEQAVMRLGNQRLRTLVVEYASREVFQSHDPRIAAANRRLWEHVVAVAHLSRELAARARVDGEVSFLAGLLHDVGKPVVAAMLLEAERRFTERPGAWLDAGGWSQAIDRCHRTVGVSVAVAWKLPVEVTAAIRDCTAYDGGARRSVANVVRLANAIAKQAGFVTGPIDDAELQSMTDQGKAMIELDDDWLAATVAALPERVAEATRGAAVAAGSRTLGGRNR